MIKLKAIIFTSFLAVVLVGAIPNEILKKEYKAERGIATWYGTKPFLGNRTPSGIICDGKTPQVAHKTLPFGVIVKIRNLRNQRVVYGIVTDRGPYIKGRIVDLNPKWMMDQLCGKKCGMAKVELTVINDQNSCRKYGCLSPTFGKYLDLDEIEYLGLTKPK